MSQTVDQVERAQMMLSLNMNEQGEALSAQERADLEALVATQEGPVTVEPIGDPEPTVGAPSVSQAPGLTDIQQMIAAEVAKQTQGGGAAPVSLEQVLQRIDPRDSDAALALFEWLCDHGRIGIVGTLNGGGYLLHYTEPKGSTKAGYSPGGTQGGRMVDQAVAKAKESGAKPRQTGMCDKCWSAVEKVEDGTVVTDDDTKDATCPQGGAHNFNA